MDFKEIEEALGIKFGKGMLVDEMPEAAGMIAKLRTRPLGVMPVLRKGERRIALLSIETENGQGGGGPVLCYLDHRDDQIKPTEESQTTITRLDTKQENDQP